MALVTYDEAVAHLRLSIPTASPPSDAENDLNLKIAQAEAIVMSHLKRYPTDAGDEAVVVAAVLRVLGNLHRFRGDDEQSVSPVSADVVAMLSMLRDPSLA